MIPPAEAIVISDRGFRFLESSELLSPLPTGASLVQIFLWVSDLQMLVTPLISHQLTPPIITSTTRHSSAGFGCDSERAATANRRLKRGHTAGGVIDRPVRIAAIVLEMQVQVRCKQNVEQNQACVLQQNWSHDQTHTSR